MRKLLEVDKPREQIVEDALGLLRDWNLRTDVENSGAALAILAFQGYFGADLDTLQTSTLLASLEKAARLLLEAHGRLDVPWGEVNRLIRGDVDLPVSGGPDVLRAVYGRLRDDGRLQGRAGDSFILMVEWDRLGLVRSQSIHQYGSATQDRNSPHYSDQAGLFVRQQMKPVWMDEADIRANLEAEYASGEENHPARQGKN